MKQLLKAQSVLDQVIFNIGAISVRVHILDPAALATSSQALMSFWPYGDVEAGNVYNQIIGRQLYNNLTNISYS